MPQIEWRGGTCRVKWWAGEYYPSGRRKYESKGGFTVEEEAWNYGLDREHEQRHGHLIRNRDGSTLMSDWCDTWEKSLDHGPLTEKGYRGHLRKHIKPYFERRTVGEIDIVAYRGFKKHLGGVVGEGSAKNILMVFGMLMEDAVGAGLRSASPVERQRRRGRYKKKPRERKRHMRAESVYQLAVNAKQYWGFPGYVFMLTMAVTGMRPGELYGLRREYSYPNWPSSDPDPDGEHAEPEPERYKGDGGMPAIRVQMQRQRDRGELLTLPPKYGSYRTLVIPQFLATLLRLLLDSHDEEWVFPGIKGGELVSTNFDGAYWRPIADGCEERKATGDRRRRPIPEIPAVPDYEGKRMYLLRHGHKEWLDDSGRISRVAVESRMGHELPGVEGVYSNVTPTMERETMGVLQERWVRLMESMRLHQA